MNKKHIWYESRFWVILYATVTVIIMGLQFILGLLDSYEIVFKHKIINDFVNGYLNLPMEVMSWVWTAIISFYCGSDRVVDVAKTTKLAVGQTSMGDLAKLRAMILISLVLFITAVVFNFLTDKEYCLAAYASAFGMTVLSYVVGNKAVKSASYLGKHEDKNQDGVPDKFQDRFDKWKRKQVRAGVENMYITWDYFLDDPENIDVEKELRPQMY